MADRYFLGVDIGGTKSDALIADDSGKVLGFARTGCGNHEVIGYDAFGILINDLMATALHFAGLDITQLSGAGLGIGGYDWPSQRTPLMARITGSGLCCPLEMVNDTLIGLVAGAPSGWGIALVAGTGSNCWGMDASGRFGRMTGLSHLMDEGGGAGSIVLEAMQAVGRAWTQRGPQTTLTERFLEQYDQTEVIDLLALFAANPIAIDASLAPMIFSAAHAGDTVAAEIIQHAAQNLASLCLGVGRQLNLLNKKVDVVLIGSVFKADEILIQPLQTAIQSEMPRANLVRLDVPPVVGGVLLGMQAAGVEPDLITVSALKASANKVALNKT